MKFAVRARFPETTCPTQTDTQEENGMLTFRQLELKKTEKLEKPTFVPDASGQTKLTVPFNEKSGLPIEQVFFYLFYLQ